MLTHITRNRQVTMISRITISLRKNIRAGEEDDADAWILNDPIVTLPSIGAFNRDGVAGGGGRTGTGTRSGLREEGGGGERRRGRGNVEATTWAFGMGGRADGLLDEDSENEEGKDEGEGDGELDDDVGLESLDSIDDIEVDMDPERIRHLLIRRIFR